MLKAVSPASTLPPSGAAGGSLAGTYPNPSIASDVSLPGNPTTTTQAPGDNSTRISTTAFVTAAVAAAVAGSVTAVSVASANGFAGSSSGGTTPSLTLSTTITGLIKGNGTALSAATAGADYSAGTASLGTGILKSTTGTGALTIAVAADFPTLNQNTTGSAASLTTPRNINGVAFDGTADITITASTTNPLTVSTGLALNSGTTFDGSVARTITIDSTVVTLTGSQTLTNKSIVATQLTGTLQAAQFPALTGDVTTTAGSLGTTLATVNSNVGSFGSATQVGTFTVNAKGLITAASNVTISGVAPGGSAGGDLSDTYPNPTVAKINGVALGTTTATAGNLLIGSGTDWVTNAVTGDITINSSGVTAIGALKVTNAMLAGSIADSKLSTISTAGKVSNSATTATDANTASAIVARDGSGNFSAGTITANLTGTASTATVANTVSSANEATDTTCFPLFITASGTQSLQPKNNTGLTYNSNTNVLGATTFTGALSGNASTATALQNARTIGGVSFDGTANITVATATGGFTVSGGNLALGANSLTLTGSIASTGSRVTKGWFTDLECTNAIVGSITGNAATVTTNANLTGAVTSVGNATSLGSFSSANLSAALTDETGSGLAVFGTAPTLSLPVIDNLKLGYTTTATAAGTTTLTSASNNQQFFTGSTTQTVVLPVTSTLALGETYRIVNNSTGVVTVQSSGGNTIIAMVANSEAVFTVILTSGTTAASWSGYYTGFTAVTGTGSNVLATSPTLVTPNLGTPTALVGTNITGTAASLTAGTATNIAGGALGSLPYQSSAGSTSLLAGNTTTAKQYLSQTGNGTVSAAPAWATIAQADISGLKTSDSPTFAGLTLTGNLDSWSSTKHNFYTNSGVTLKGFVGCGRNGDLTLESVTLGNWLRLASNGNISFWMNGNGSVNDTPQISFDNTGKISAASLNLSGLTASKPVFTDGSKNLTSSGTVPVDQGGTGQTTYTNGQLLIGNTTGNTLTKSTLTGTANQVTVTNGPGSITFSTPQDIATGSSPTFAGITLSGLTASYPVITDGSKNLASANTAGDYYFGANTASSDTNADTNITLMSSVNTKSAQLNVSNSNATSFFTVWSGRVGDTSTALIYSSATDLRIGTATSGQLGTAGFTERFRFTSGGAFRVVGLTASKPVFTDGSKNLTNTGTMPVDQGGTGQTTYTNGQLLIGNTTGNTLTKSTVTGTANQITVTNGPGSITFSTPQDIGTGSSPTFADITLSNSIASVGGYPSYVARSWVNFNGTGAIALTGSGNVTSLTDNGTGDYTVNFANSLASASFCAVVTGQESAPGSPAVNGTAYAAVKRVSTAYAASSIRVQTGNSGGGVDFVAVNVAVFI